MCNKYYFADNGNGSTLHLHEICKIALRAGNVATGLRLLPSRPVVRPVSATEIAPGDLFPLFIAPRAATFFYKYRTVKAHAISLFCRLVEVYASFASMSTSPLSLLRCSSEGDIFSPARSLKGNFSCRY